MLKLIGNLDPMLVVDLAKELHMQLFYVLVIAFKK